MNPCKNIKTLLADTNALRSGTVCDITKKLPQNVL